MDKIESHALDYHNFKTAITENPEILDFFDIFNNKILENMTIVIHRQILRRLNGLSNSLEHLIEQISAIQKNKKGLTITLNSFIERSIKKESLLNEGVIITKSSENQSTNNHNYFISNKNNNLNTAIFNNSNTKNNKSDIGASTSCNNSGSKKETYDQNNNNENIKDNKRLNNNKTLSLSRPEVPDSKDITNNSVMNNNKKKEDENIYDDKVIMSFDLDNSIYTKKEDSKNQNKMFSVSKKLNVPFFPDNDDEEEDIDNLSEEDLSETDNSFAATEKSQIYEKMKNNKEDNLNFNQKSNNVSNIKEDNTKSNTYINDVSNNEGIQFDKKIINERINFNANLLDGKTQNILVNNINNIHNINIVNNGTGEIQNLQNLNNLGILNKKTYQKLNSGLPPNYNITKNYSIKTKNKEEAIKGKLFCFQITAKKLLNFFFLFFLNF